MDKALFLDRDGTLIFDQGYIGDPAYVRLLPGVVQQLRLAAAAGFLLLVVTNQSGVGRGKFTRHQAALVQSRFLDLLEKEGVELDGYYACYHAPEDGCQCRKPAPGLLRLAAEDYEIDFRKSIIVGDHENDVGVTEHFPGLMAYRVLKNEPWELFAAPLATTP
jgi:histidinol-phosphate phosphatase family protein